MGLSTAWSPTVETPHQNWSRYRRQPSPPLATVGQGLNSLKFLFENIKKVLTIMFVFFIPETASSWLRFDSRSVLLKEIASCTVGKFIRQNSKETAAWYHHTTLHAKRWCSTQHRKAGQPRMRVHSTFNFLGETGCLTLGCPPISAFLGEPTPLLFSYEIFLKNTFRQRLQCFQLYSMQLWRYLLSVFQVLM